MSVEPAPDAVLGLLAGARTRPLVVVTVGSDHHRFDRLVGWVDQWAAGRDDVDCVIQHGTAAAPRNAIGVDYVDHALLASLLAAADVVVVQGGPMSIIEARNAGKRPLVVARVARLAEVVDGHQVTFCTKLAAEGHIELFDEGAALAHRLDAVVAEPGQLAVDVDSTAAGRVLSAVTSFARVASGLLPQPRGERPSVLLLGGAGRSGSTLLERLLDHADGATALGEVLHLWERGLVGDELCGCGKCFSDCEFWSEVGNRAFGGWTDVDGPEVADLREAVVRTRRSPSLLGAPTSPRQRLSRDRFARVLDRLYAAARDTAGGDVLVDSSKHAPYALLLRRVRVDLRCVLVVRDPRAVAYSWRRTVLRPEVVDREENMPRYGATYTALSWSMSALMFEGLRALRVPVLVLRYEDLVARPLDELQRVLAFAGLSASVGGLGIEGASVHLRESHTVAGNPMRFRTGRIELRPDDQWRTELPAADRRRVAWLTRPLRRRYGYR